MKNRLIIGLAFFYLVNFGGLAVASQQLADQTSLSVKIKPFYNDQSGLTTN